MLFNKKAGVLDKINVESSHMIWRSLVDRNITIEHFNVLKNFVHDKEFKGYLEKKIKEYKREADKLVELINNYSLPSPDPSSVDQNIPTTTGIFRDMNIAETLMRFMRLDISVLMMSMKETPTNKDIYEFVMHLARAAINRIDDYIEYMKSKNWLYLSPEYRHANPETERVADETIYLLWDHLIFR